MPGSPERGATIVWFRRDLRLNDHPALNAAVRRNRAVIPVFVWPTDDRMQQAPGSAGRWWLHHSLAELDRSLRRIGSRLILRRGSGIDALIRLTREAGASAVFWNRCYEPVALADEDKICDALSSRGVDVRHFNASLINEPWAVGKSDGTPYRVFTAYYRACRSLADPGRPLASPSRLPPPAKWPRGESLDDWCLLPRIDWAAGIRRMWSPGENGALARWSGFLSAKMESYPQQRDRPDIDSTSCLSPHLHFGEISVRRLWHDLRALCGKRGADIEISAHCFLRQLYWREFAYHLLYHFPHTPEAPLRPEFAAFPWKSNRRRLTAWQRGETGYPIVDAGMHQLWATGWLHNRVRMIVASFLVKHLLLPWRLGARWFWDTLVDADLANNTLGWQWSAGCGADAAPYFRIFNPVLQGRKFDPDGTYVRRWIPQLSGLPATVVHAPWQAPEATLRAAGIRLGRDYPRPIVEHGAARRQALSAYHTFRRKTRGGA